MSFQRGTREWGEPLRFPLVNVIVAGSPRRVHRITCGGCGSTDDVMCKRNVLAVEQVRRTLQRRGWEVGRTARLDRCPKCTGHPKVHLTEETPTKGSDMAQPVKGPEPAKAEAPRAMDTDDAITISLKLAEVYDKGKGYCDGFTDAIVARDLGCPRAWVQAVRRKHFGEDGGNDELREARADVEKALQRYAELAADASAAIEANTAVGNNLQRLRNEVMQQANALHARLDRIDKALK